MGSRNGKPRAGMNGPFGMECCFYVVLVVVVSLVGVGGVHASGMGISPSPRTQTLAGDGCHDNDEGVTHQLSFSDLYYRPLSTILLVFMVLGRFSALTYR